MEWSDSFYTGIEEIDRQHMELIHMLNRVHESIRHSGCHLRELVLQSIESIQDHFTFEETLLRRYCRPKYRKHREKHLLIMDNIKSIQSFLDQNTLNQYTGEFIIGETEKWLKEHFERMDTDVSGCKAYLDAGRQKCSS